MFAKQVVAVPSDSIATEPACDPIVDCALAMRLLQRHVGYAPWKIVFPGTVVMSEQICSMIGLDQPLEAAPLPAFVERFHEGDRGKLLYLIAQSLENRRGFHARLRTMHPKSGERMVETFADLRIRDERVTEIFGISRDVTAELQRETAGMARSRLSQDVIANMPSPIALLDDKLRIVDCNKYWLRCHQQADKKDVVGRSFQQLFADAPAEIRTDFMRALRGEIVQTKRQFVNSTTSRPMTCSVTVAPWYVAGDQIGGVMTLIGWSEFGISKMAPNKVTAPAPANFDGSLLDLADEVEPASRKPADARVA